MSSVLVCASLTMCTAHHQHRVRSIESNAPNHRQLCISPVQTLVEIIDGKSCEDLKHASRSMWAVVKCSQTFLLTSGAFYQNVSLDTKRNRILIRIDMICRKWTDKYTAPYILRVGASWSTTCYMSQDQKFESTYHWVSWGSSPLRFSS